MLHEEQEAFLNRKKKPVPQEEAGCCFCFFKSKKQYRKISEKKRPEQMKPEEEKETHGFSTNMLSTEWVEYLNQQLEKNTTSSSVQLLGFNWAEQLLEYISDQQFAVQKYRSAIFYHNYSVRQMRVESDLDGLIVRKQTLLDQKLRKMDQYPNIQNFIQESQSQSVVLTEGGKISEVNQRQQRLSSQGALPTKKSQAQLSDPSRLSFIYDDDVTRRMKNIEEFGAPLSQIDRVLLSILVQMRTNLNEKDHPINLIVTKFQSIILENVEKIKYKYRFSSNLFTNLGDKGAIGSRGRSLSKPEVLEINYTSMGLAEEKEEKRPVHTSFKMPSKDARKTALLTRTTYNRETLNSLPQEIKFAEIVIAELKKLICLLYGTLIRFYIPVMRYEDLNDMKEDLIELLTSLTIKGELSKTVLQLCRLSTKEDEVILAQKFQELKSVKTGWIGIDKLFRLDTKLVETGDIGGSKEKPIAFKSVIEPIQLIQEQPKGGAGSKSLLLPIQDILSNPEQQHTPLTKQLANSKPYILAIQNLRKIRTHDTPIDKMRCITQTSKCIVDSIDIFYRDVVVDRQRLTLDADQLLMIFIFVTIRSKVYELLAHLKMINEFSTNTLRLSKLGYCILTLEVALQQIIGMDVNTLRNGKLEISNAAELMEQSMQSLQSEYPFIVKDDVFELVDEYDRTLERSFRKGQDEEQHMSFEQHVKSDRQ
ncbi:hypothetical protein FGO68_gene10367 [Halteria grandinella]|uniref:VPS9 domain-containing protein n=1 Tax=Halteria grandinella TaxID=5974 RepID=A0A8J8P6K9_HALGN|nr:hypothetical protein FGO68_gene10367 [Halteria grandinella]